MLLLLVLTSLASAAPRLHGFGLVGVGLPEVLMAEAGGFVADRWSVEARYGNVVFNHMVGIGATAHLFGDLEGGGPPTHSLLVSPQLMVNPTLGGLTLQGGGETIGATAGAALGYGFRAERGFLLRARVPLFFYEDDGLAFGGGLSVAGGWGF
jgi:hypothetical protein